MVSLEVGVGENIPGILGACATGNFTYLERGLWTITPFEQHTLTLGNLTNVMQTRTQKTSYSTELKSFNIYFRTQKYQIIQNQNSLMNMFSVNKVLLKGC